MAPVNLLHKGDVLEFDFSTLPHLPSLVLTDPPFNTGNDFGSYNDQWSSMEEYLAFLIPRLKACWDHLAENGNLIVHLDWRSSHYVKVEFDKIAGYENFVNEIVWPYNSGGASRKHLSRKHDVLLLWSKPDATFNVLREPYATPNVQGRAGFHPEGRMLTDVWNIPFISTTSKERTGYPTQKPLALAERAIRVFTNPGDLVFDPFCGSGTTGVAAKKLGRDYLLMDVGSDAYAMAASRLANS